MFNIIEFARSAKRKIPYFNLLPIIFIFLMFAACPAYAGSAPSTDILVQCNSSGVVTNNTAITGVNLPTIQYDSTGNFYLNSVDVAVYSGSTLVKELDGYTTTNLQVALGAVTNYDYNATNPVVYEIKYRGHYGVVGAGAQDITEDWKSSELYFRAISTYTITYDGNNFTGGSVPTDSNNYTTGAAITVLGNTGSLVKIGNTFAGWNTAADGSGTSYAAGATLTMGAANVTLYAQWMANPTYTITYDGNNFTGGSVPTDSSNYTTGAAITVLGYTDSLVKTGYTFAGWNTAADGSGTSYAAGATLSMGSANVTLYAQWMVTPPLTHTVSVSSNPPTGGTVSGGGTYNEGASVTVTATANSGYSFVNWTENGSAVSTSTAYTFTLGTADRTLVANFAAIPPATHTVEVSANPAAGGTVTGGNTYNEGASVTVTATANNGYSFTNWTENGSAVSTEASYTFTLGTADRTLVANFAAIPPVITTGTISGTVTDGTNPLAGATVSLTVSGSVYSATTAGDGSYAILNVPAGTDYTVTAGLTGYTRANATNVNVTANTTTSGVNLTLSVIPPATHTVAVTANPAADGTVSGGGTYAEGASVTVTATPGSGYSFVNWTENGSAVSTSAVYTFTLGTADRTLVANFAAILTHTISYDGNGSTGGNVPATVTSCVYGQNVTVLGNIGSPPLTKNGYTFNGWNTTANGSGTSYAAGNTFSMGSANVTLYAQWTVMSNNNGGGGGSHTSSPTSTTVTGSVVNGTTGANVSNITATVTADSSGNDTVSMSAAQVAVLKQPDGTMSPLSDFSKVAIATSAGTPVTISAEGTIQVANLTKGTDNNFNITYDLGNGQKITIATMEIKIDSSGNVTLTTTLIDPYGIITDAATGKDLAGVNVTLYYADTERNKAAGKTPDTVVALPSIAGFKPNNNQDPQTSDSSGAYGFMVFPTTDYYIVATKGGYAQYTSPTISVEQEIVHWDFKMSPTISGVTRLAGLSRVDTALAIAKANYPGQVTNVILATADNYPDALAGSVLAYKLNAPILLVGSSDADQAKVLDYLKANLDTAGTVYILGGTTVVSKAMESEVEASGFTHITRIAGADRYETSVKIADQLQVKTGTPLVLVSGENYPDALSVSSIAAQMQLPILLVQKDGISDSVSQEIAAIKPAKVYIIGGEGVISASVESQVAQLTGLAQGNIVRIGGADRYATSLEVAQYFNLTGQNVCLATGNDFPDALAGSVYAANHNAPIILADGSLSDQVMNYLKARKITGATLFGGETVVGKDVEQQLAQLIGK